MYTVPDPTWPTETLNPPAPPADSTWSFWELPDINRDDREGESWWSNTLDDETHVTAPTPLAPILHPTAALPPPKRQKISSTTSTPKPRKQLSTPASSSSSSSSPMTAIRKQTTKGSKTKPISSHIPFEIWLEIFSYCAPSQLAKLRRVNSSFKAFIDDEKIWAKSRRNTFPNYPEPMYGFPENYMWNLWKGSGCEICGAPRFKKCYWTWGIRLCTACFKENRIRGDEIVGDREFVNAALVCLRHCFVSGKFVSTQRGNYYGLGGGDPCYWKDEVAAFRAEYAVKKNEDIEKPGTLATFIEIEKDKVKFQMETAVKMCEFERQEATARREELAEIRRQRLISIPEKCKQHFTPPIPEGVLDLIPSYQTALKAGNVLTDRGWKTLVTKITGERSKAEAQYRSHQEQKERAHREYTNHREQAQKDEILHHMNIQKLRAAIPDLLKHARSFIRKEGGLLIEDQSRVQSFVLETIKYCRRTWYEENPGETLPFRSAYFLWEELLEARFGLWPGMHLAFCCEYCGDKTKGSWEYIILHLASEHAKKPGVEKLVRQPIEFLPEEKVIKGKHVPDWDGAEWPENIPVIANGPKYTPRYLKPLRLISSASSSASTSVCKAKKPKKHGTGDSPMSSESSFSHKSSITSITPRSVIARKIDEVSMIPVPPFFQLSLFFKKMVLELKDNDSSVGFNELYYEFVRLAEQPKPPSWFSHDSMACNTCLHTWDGKESIITLMQHFFEKHHQNNDWQKDMLLMPGPPDVLKMLQAANDRGIERLWNLQAEPHHLDGAKAREKVALADQRGEVLCSIDELKLLRVLKKGEDVREGVERRLGEILIRDENGSEERKRKRELEDEVELEEDVVVVASVGKGKGKERDESPFEDEFGGSGDEEWEDKNGVGSVSDGDMDKGVGPLFDGDMDLDPVDPVFDSDWCSESFDMEIDNVGPGVGC